MEFKIRTRQYKNGMFKFIIILDKINILSSEFYTTKDACNGAIGSLKLMLKSPYSYHKQTDYASGGEFFIKYKNGQILVQSIRFDSIAYMEIIINNLINSNFK